MQHFGANKIIKEKIISKDLSTYFVGFDIDDKGDSYYRINELVKLLMRVIPEFAFGHHLGPSVDNTEVVDMVSEAAKAIYSIDVFQAARSIYESDDSINDDVEDKYLRRGEFGELILHLLLRDYKDTIPLISKIYFKDSLGATVHGFDAVHIQESTKTLWLGESKIYTDGKKGVSALTKDIKEHFSKGYLTSEFAIISRKVKHVDNISKKKHWIELLNGANTLSEQLNNINIPLLCTYQSSLYKKYNDEKIEGFIKDFETEVTALKSYFEANCSHPFRSKLNIILLLFPIKDKKELVRKLHKNLSLMQNIGEV